MKTYELTYIITPDKNMEEAEVIAKETEFFLQEKQGVILKSEKAIPRTLSYRIKKYGSGFFASLEFQAESETIFELNGKLEKNANILRHIILAKTKGKKMKEKRERKKPKIMPETPIIKNEEKKLSPAENTVESKPKIDIEDIDKKLDEILSE